MSLFIYVLLLSIWASSCLNTNQSDGSSTTVSSTGAKIPEPTTETEVDSFKKRLNVHLIGISCTTLFFICFFYFHYHCLKDDCPKEEGVKKHGAVKLPKSSIISFGKYKRDDPWIPEKQPMLSDFDKLSEPSSSENSSSSSENVISSLSLENSCIPSSAENLIKPSSPKGVSRKSHRKCSLVKSHKLAHAHKLGSQIRLSYSNTAVRPPSTASLQHPLGPTETLYPTCPQNQILLLKSSGVHKYTKSPRHPNLKRSFSTDMVDMLCRSQLVNSCRCHRGKCFVCRNTSESLPGDISEAKTNAQNPPFPCEGKPLSKSFNKVDFRDNTFCGNASDSDKMIHDDDGDSEREITIICD